MALTLADLDNFMLEELDPFTLEQLDNMTYDELVTAVKIISKSVADNCNPDSILPEHKRDIVVNITYVYEKLSGVKGKSLPAQVSISVLLGVVNALAKFATTYICEHLDEIISALNQTYLLLKSFLD